MPSEQFRLQTVEALRNTRKGRLRYCRDWSPLEEGILEEDKAPPVLSRCTGWVLEKIISHSPKSDLLAKCTPEGASLFHGLSLEIDASPVIQDSPPPSLTEAPADDQKWRSTGSNQEPLTLTPPSKSTGVEGLIHLHKEIQKLKGKEQLKQRLEQQEQAGKAACEEASELLKRFDELKELKQHQEYQHLQQEMENSSKEAQGQQEKLKEEHRRRAKLLSRKLREAEQQRQRQEDLERQRREESQERLRRLYAIQEEVLQIHQQVSLGARPKELPTVDFSLFNNRGNQLCGEVSALVRVANEAFPTEADVSSADHVLLKMHQLLSDMQQEIALALEERKKKEEEEMAALAAAAAAEAKKTEELQKRELAKSQASDPGNLAGGLQVKADASIMKWYQELQKESQQCVASFSCLASSKGTQEKKIKMELQKAATIPVSQISTIAGSQLKEIFEKIHSFLSGKYVQCGGHKVSVTQHPEGLAFVYFKLAEKFVKQGEEEVASHHKAAFPIAVVASGIWELHPKVGTLILAHLHKKCPYAVPFYPAMKEGTPLAEYQRTLGYQVKDGKVEPQDNFLKRMSGMIRLYAAILQLQWPYQDKQGTHPHGLNHAWRWLAQMLNMEPLADVTATVLFDFLEVCGNALMKQYQVQFWKLLLLIQEEYFPRIEAITSPGEMGSLIRFKQFLKECLQRKNIPLPKGYLQPSFWKS